MLVNTSQRLMRNRHVKGTASGVFVFGITENLWHTFLLVLVCKRYQGKEVY